LNLARLQAMAATALEAVQARAEEFSALDAVGGDGDHGTAIVSALAAVQRAAEQGSVLKQTLSDMGFAAMSESCGSTSALVGSLFLGLGDAVDGEQLDAPATAAMFASGLANVQQQTKATVGDKTLMDALIPAVQAMQAHTDEGIQAMLDAAAAAAAEGAESTKGLVARYGRARNLGDRVVGHADAGATSMACIFDAFARGFSHSN
jgi:dihydroxyacetone kinase-like protein